MKPTNYEERNRIIGLFSAIYLTCCFVLIYWFSLLIIFVPKEQVKRQLAGKDELMAVLDYTNDADSLVVQIQKQKELEGKTLMPFFKWTNDLRGAYPEPFYQSVINSYVGLVNETIDSRQNDSALAVTREKFATLRKEGLALRKENEALREKLMKAKTR